ncbi:MAG: MarR family transcriptional regulator [Acidimicrobiales bacterium]
MTASDGPVPAPEPFTDAQRSVLYAIRRRGEATAEQLAGALGITLSGVRQHLAALVDAGLVASSSAPRVDGRRGPSGNVHRLTERAESLFPKAYGELTNQILGYLEPEAVTQVFVRRRDDRIAAGRARVAKRRGFAARVRELAAILDEDGYLADVQQIDRDRFRVTEHNCAILSVAREHPHACSSEIEFIRAVLPDASVERTTHMMAGDHSCSYEITRGTTGGSA